MRVAARDAKLCEVTRCLIVDDSPSFLEAAMRVPQRDGITVVGTAGTIDAALDRARELQPDAVLIDIWLGSESGFDLARRLADHEPNATLILVSTHPEEDLADLIAEAPVAGFVSKSQLSADTVRRMVNGPQER